MTHYTSHTSVIAGPSALRTLKSNPAIHAVNSPLAGFGFSLRQHQMDSSIKSGNDRIKDLHLAHRLSEKNDG